MLQVFLQCSLLLSGDHGDLVAQSCLTLAISWTVAHQVPLSMGSPRQEYWSGLPFPPPGDLPDPGIKPISPALQADIFTNWAIKEAPSNTGSSQTQWEKRTIQGHVQGDKDYQQSRSTWRLTTTTSSSPSLPSHTSLIYLSHIIVNSHYFISSFMQQPNFQVCDAIQPSHPLSSPSPPAFNLSQHQNLFQWVSSSHQVAKVLELQLSISPSSEYSRLISFRIDWLDLLAVQGILKSLLKHHSSKA